MTVIRLICPCVIKFIDLCIANPNDSNIAPVYMYVKEMYNAWNGMNCFQSIGRY